MYYLDLELLLFQANRKTKKTIKQTLRILKA